MKRPVIGISGNRMLDTENGFIGRPRSYVSDDYIRSVISAGGIPLILPIVSEEAVVRAQAELIDGLILSGGQDIQPHLWGEEPHRDIEELLPPRDDFDMLLIQYMTLLKKPILGICRGEQILNAVHGGTLYQDLSHKEECYIKHRQQCSADIATHQIEVYKGSWLYEVLGERTWVNSYHHQAVKEVGKGFKVSAVSKDGVIEAIEKIDESWIVGVQWHPEILSGRYPDMQRLFDQFVAEVRER